VFQFSELEVMEEGGQRPGNGLGVREASSNRSKFLSKEDGFCMGKKMRSGAVRVWAFGCEGQFGEMYR